MRSADARLAATGSPSFRGPRAAIAATWLAVATFFLASPVFAAITITSTSATIDGSGLDFFTLASDHQTFSDSSFTSFNHSVQATTHGHNGVELDDSASQDTEIIQDTDTLTIKSSGSFSTNHTAPNAANRENLKSSASSSVIVRFCINEPHSFSTLATGQIEGPAGLFNNGTFRNIPFFSGLASAVFPASDFVGTGLITLAAVNENPSPGPSGSFSSTGVLPAPGCFEVNGGVGGSLTSPLFVPSDPVKTAGNPPSATGKYQLTVEIGPVPPPGNVFPWTGPSGGGFGNPANWKPDNDIPSFVDGSRSDTALFQNLRALTTVDLSSSAAIARIAAPAVSAAAPVGQCAGVVTRSIGRLEVDNTKSLEPINGILALDSLSLDEPSLTVLSGGRLELDQSALCAQHALIGGGGGLNFLDVAKTGFLQTVGRLSVGQAGAATLSISNGGVVQSEEVRLGAGDQTGTADVDNATWNTGNMAIGFQSTGELTIENAGLVNSEQGFVASELPGGPDPGFGATSSCLGRRGAAGGVEVEGTNSTWNLQNLFIGPLGCVEVTKDGLINAMAGDAGLGDVLIGADDSGSAHLLVNDGGALITANGLTVGDGGDGELILSAAGGSEVAIAEVLAVGKGGSTATFGSGQVTVNGDPTVSSPALTSDTVVIGEDSGTGGLKLTSDANVVTNTIAEVGLDGLGIVKLDGSAGNTRWQIGTSLTIGSATAAGTGLVFVGDSTIDVGSDSSPGTVVVNAFGSLSGIRGSANHVLTHGGMITNIGTIEGPMELDGNYDPSSTGMLSGNISGLVTSSAPITRASNQSGMPVKSPPPPAQGPIVITGDADVSGSTLLMQFVNGFAPRQGDTFQVVQILGQATGNFADVQISGLEPGAAFSVDPQTGVATSMTNTVAQPVVNLKGPKTLKESAKAGAKLTFTRKGDTSAPMTVNYQVSGSATNGVDYATLPGAFVIPAKKKSATLVITPYNDGYFEPTETIEVEVLAGDQYSVGLTPKVSINLQNVDPKIKKIKKK